MQADWAVIDALLGGTPAMRKAGKKYLPQQPRESNEDYEYRLSTSTLFPAFERTLAVMAGKPFSKEVTPSDVPQPVLGLLPSIDDKGSSLHTFAFRAFREMVSHGFGGILVDHTKTEGQAVTVADTKRMGARPYWVHYKHNQILGARFTQSANGQRLVLLRLLETVEEEDGDYGSQEVQQVRVLRPGTWEIHRNGKDGWVLHDSGTTTLERIPFVFLVANPVGPMEGRPPLKDLAYLNVKHWQQQSDQDESARFCRKRLLVFTGLTSQDEITVASDMAVRLPKDADAKIVEGSAESIEVGRSELEALEQQMIQTGAELLVAKPGQRTATEASNDAEANKSSLQSLVEDFEDALDQCLQFSADWLKVGEGGSVSLFKDFGAATLSDASAQLVFNMVGAGWLSKVTGIKEMQRRGTLDPAVDPEQEIAAAEAEGPALGTIGGE
ncbi:MAG: DUF4055 domain-containing protein [Delftia sp.]|nr:DUF4055 domain-containing protein [Delftia sp.]MPT54969.1 DUF4055 domain-containing protein [Delftia sp.]